MGVHEQPSGVRLVDANVEQQIELEYFEIIDTRNSYAHLGGDHSGILAPADLHDRVERLIHSRHLRA